MACSCFTCSSTSRLGLHAQAQPRRLCFESRHNVIRISKRTLCIPRAESEDGEGSSAGGKDSAESLFQKELKRRGISGAGSERSSSRTSTSQSDPPPPAWSSGQLEKSRKLNSEGLEGLIPRASQLLQLGLSFFLAFGPAVIIISIFFSSIYLVWGESFIHGGRKSFTGPTYVDPAELLSEPTVDPRIPFR